MNKVNYQRELDMLLAKLAGERDEGKKSPRLLLHSCCAPCSSYCIEYLSGYFDITVFYYNPNLYPDEEYIKRVREQEHFIELFDKKIKFVEGDFEKELFYETVRGFEDEPERGKRCALCFGLRLSKTADMAKREGFDYFATTLTISPQKDAGLINRIGQSISDDVGVCYLASDFKKKNGYKRSVELSNEYGMYRQDYCGCRFSVRKADPK